MQELTKDEVLGWIDSTSDINDLVEVNNAVHDRAELVGKMAKETFAVITTSDTRPYGCFIFTKGVLKPDGSVWMI